MIFVVTKRDKRAVRVLKMCRCVPYRPAVTTFAEVGVQAAMPYSHQHPYVLKLSQIRDQVQYISVLVERYLPQQRRTRSGLVATFTLVLDNSTETQATTFLVALQGDYSECFVHYKLV